MAIESTAAGGAEAIHGAGTVVNHLDLTTESAIRRAVSIAGAAASQVKPRVEGTGQFGRYTGLRIAKFQNWLYEQNCEWHFTDGTLCVLWCVEFPDAKSDYPARSHYIASTRRDYNAGRHQAPAPTVPCVGYPPTAKQAASRAPAVIRPGPVKSEGLTRGLSRPEQSEGGSSLIAVGKLSFASDPHTTLQRRRKLEAYIVSHVLREGEFICRHFGACKSSHSGDFFEGQLHHVGEHYDMSANGRPLRIVVVGQEYGNGPARVTIEARTRMVAVETGLQKRFFTDGGHGPRNPHMRGTTSVLRLLAGHSLGRDYAGEWIDVGAGRIHLFNAFALTNFLLCSAIAGGQGDEGSKRGCSTRTMQHRCGEHFAAALRILEPTVVVTQGKAVRGWMAPLLEQVQTVTPHLERAAVLGHEFLLASFSHPSAPSREYNWGTDERRPYLHQVVAPTVRRIHFELGLVPSVTQPH